VEEEELDIRAGLQDRVIQTYGGVVYMDFDRQLIEKRGYGEYIPLSPFNLPPLFLAYVDKPKDSGRVHSDVRARWMRGDQDVVDAMRTFAGFAEAGKDALARKDWDALSLLMNQNFDLRLRLFGEKVIGERDLELVSIGRSLGAPTKFSGSGGAVVGIWRDKEQLESLRARYIQQGFAFTDVQVDAGTHRIA
jgi:glucuronokinase